MDNYLPILITILAISKKWDITEISRRTGLSVERTKQIHLFDSITNPVKLLNEYIEYSNMINFTKEEIRAYVKAFGIKFSTLQYFYPSDNKKVQETQRILLIELMKIVKEERDDKGPSRVKKS